MVYEIKVVRGVLKEDAPQLPIRNAKQVVDYAMTHCYEADELWRESVWLLLVNRAGQIYGQYEVSKGGTAMAAIDKKVICKVAIEMMASAVVLVHNHPSGSSKPSTADIRQTSEVKRALDLFDIGLLDHVIIGEGEFYSFSEEKIERI